MNALLLNIPVTVDFDNNEAVMAIASRLYAKGKLSLGQAAELTGFSKSAFLEVLTDFNVSPFNYPPSDLDKELENAKKIIISDTSCLILFVLCGISWELLLLGKK